MRFVDKIKSALSKQCGKETVQQTLNTCVIMPNCEHLISPWETSQFCAVASSWCHCLVSQKIQFELLLHRQIWQTTQWHQQFWSLFTIQDQLHETSLRLNYNVKLAMHLTQSNFTVTSRLVMYYYAQNRWCHLSDVSIRNNCLSNLLRWQQHMDWNTQRNKAQTRSITPTPTVWHWQWTCECILVPYPTLQLPKCFSHANA